MRNFNTVPRSEFTATFTIGWAIYRTFRFNAGKNRFLKSKVPVRAYVAFLNEFEELVDFQKASLDKIFWVKRLKLRESDWSRQ